MTYYGLTCGYWTNDPNDLDNHVIAHHEVDPDDTLYDLFNYQYDGRKLFICGNEIR